MNKDITEEIMEESVRRLSSNIREAVNEELALLKEDLSELVTISREADVDILKVELKYEMANRVISNFRVRLHKIINQEI